MVKSGSSEKQINFKRQGIPLFGVFERVNMDMVRENKEKVCSFYASDYHFEMITVPYMQKELEEQKEVIVLTENDLQGTVKVLLTRMNLTEEEKAKLLAIDWSNQDMKKLDKLKESLKEGKEISLFIKGKQNYIHTMNQKMESFCSDALIKQIDCYDVLEIGNDVSAISDHYKTILNTTGKIDRSRLE
jgi:hypothetical protein